MWSVFPQKKEIERIKTSARCPKACLALVGDGPHCWALENDFAGTPTHISWVSIGKELG